MTQIIVIGDLILDCYIKGVVSRVSPEAPVPIIVQKETEYILGGAGNVAANCALNVDKVVVIGGLAEDEPGRKFKKNIEEYSNITTHYLPNDVTTIKKRFIASDQQIMRLDKEAITHVDFNEIQKILNKEIKTKFVIVSDYAKGVCSNISKVIERNNNKNFIIDPKGRSFDKYAGAYAITPNEKEFRLAVIDTSDVSLMVQHAKDMLNRLNIKYCIITRSYQGALIIAHDSVFEIPADEVEIADVTGAGDVFIAALGCGLAKGLSMLKACTEAVKLATISVTKLGTVALAPRETTSKKMSQNNEEIIEKIQRLRIGKKLAVTNGCFDIIHAGHTDYLQKCSEIADILVVLVNSDRSIANLKGKERPLNPLMQRKAVLLGIKGVDFVLDFDADTPIEMIEKLRPDILVKGGDYDLNNIVGKDFVKSYGGDVTTIPVTYELSTTSLIKRITK